MKKKITISIDWEDFGQLSVWYSEKKIVPPKEDIDRQTNIILEILDRYQIKGTFFILGMLATFRPDLVKKIYAHGHEIASHGYSHIQLTKMSEKEAKEDIVKADRIISDIIGEKVVGFRAPLFSIDKSNFYVLNILEELGYLYDSSIFPIQLPRYGISDFPKEDCVVKLPNSKTIIEYPLTVLDFPLYSIPVSGGGYFRLFPSRLLSKAFSRIIDKRGCATIYMHPYEFDSEPLDVSASFSSDIYYSPMKIKAQNFRWNIFRKSIVNKLDLLFNTYSNLFETYSERVKHVSN